MIESASEETELLEVLDLEPDPEDQAASGGALPSNALLFTIYLEAESISGRKFQPFHIL